MAATSKYIDLLNNDQFIAFTRGMGFASYAKQTVLSFLKDYYRDPDNSFGLFVFYDDDDNLGTRPDRGIAIYDQWSYDQNVVDPRPKIVVHRGGMSATPKYISSGMTARDIRTGSRTFERQKRVNIQMDCISSEGDEAEFLADMVFASIDAYGEQLREELGWDEIIPYEISPESPTEVDVKTDKVTVSVGISGTLRSAFVKMPPQRKISALVSDDDAHLKDANGKVVPLK